MQKAYKISILYFLLFSLLLLASSIALFEVKIGFSLDAVLEYYQGNEEKFIPAKSSIGVLKIILPHIFGFGLFGMVLLHFLIFTKFKKSKQFYIFIYLTFSLLFLEMFTPFFIIWGIQFFAYFKLFSFILLELILLYIFYLLFKTIVRYVM